MLEMCFAKLAWVLCSIPDCTECLRSWELCAALTMASKRSWPCWTALWTQEVLVSTIGAEQAFYAHTCH